MREWVVGLVGEGMAPIVTTIVAAAIVILLLLIVVWVARKALGGMGPRSKGRGPRLAVMDVTVVDQKRKLVLVRRDEVEHLLLIGGQNDVVVEAGILRVPASGRAQRSEPVMQAEPEAIAPPRPAAVAAARLADMQPQGQPLRAQTRQPSAAAARAGEARVASPLTRAVPRPPAAMPAAEPELPAEEPAPVVMTPNAAPVAESAIAPSPQKVQTPPARREPDFSAAFSSAAAAPAGASEAPAAFPAVSARQGAPEADPVAAEPQITATAPAMSPFPRAEQPETSAAPSPEVVPPIAAPIEPAEAVIVSPPADDLPAAPPVPIVESPRVETVRPESRPPAPGASRQSVSQAVLPVSRGPAAIQRIDPAAIQTDSKAAQPSPHRVPISSGTEPNRRPTPTSSSAPAAPMPRSMATPTYPQRPVAPPVEPGSGSIGWAGSAPSPRDVPVTEEPKELTPDTFAESFNGNASQPPVVQPLEKDLPVRAGFGSPSFTARATPSPLIAAAERQRDAILGRSPAVESSTRPSSPIEAETADKEPAGEQTPSGLGDNAPAPREPEVSPEAPRPLSVRSFATAIQSMKPSYAPALPPVASEEPAPHAEPRPMPVFVKQPTRAEPAKAEPVAAAPWMPPVKAAATGAAAAGAVAAPAVVLDDQGSLEDFLSAELDSDFGNVRWNDEPTITPPARDDVSSDVAPAALPETPVEAPPRILTLEEEMERLLGDFDFEISDRKAK